MEGCVVDGKILVAVSDTSMWCGRMTMNFGDTVDEIDNVCGGNETWYGVDDLGGVESRAERLTIELLAEGRKRFTMIRKIYSLTPEHGDNNNNNITS